MASDIPMTDPPVTPSEPTPAPVSPETAPAAAVSMPEDDFMARLSILGVLPLPDDTSPFQKWSSKEANREHLPSVSTMESGQRVRKEPSSDELEAVFFEITTVREAALCIRQQFAAPAMTAVLFRAASVHIPLLLLHAAEAFIEAVQQKWLFEWGISADEVLSVKDVVSFFRVHASRGKALDPAMLLTGLHDQAGSPALGNLQALPWSCWRAVFPRISIGPPGSKLEHPSGVDLERATSHLIAHLPTFASLFHTLRALHVAAQATNSDSVGDYKRALTTAQPPRPAPRKPQSSGGAQPSKNALKPNKLTDFFPILSKSNHGHTPHMLLIAPASAPVNPVPNICHQELAPVNPAPNVCPQEPAPANPAPPVYQQHPAPVNPAPNAYQQEPVSPVEPNMSDQAQESNPAAVSASIMPVPEPAPAAAPAPAIPNAHVEPPVPPPFDEEAALAYMTHATPAWTDPVSKAFSKHVPKYQDSMDWIQWTKTIVRFTGSGPGQVPAAIRWRLALRHLPAKYFEIVQNTVMSPGFTGLTWRGFVDLISKHTTQTSKVQRAQKNIRNFAALPSETLRSYVMRYMSLANDAILEEDPLIPCHALPGHFKVL